MHPSGRPRSRKVTQLLLPFGCALPAALCFSPLWFDVAVVALLGSVLLIVATLLHRRRVEPWLRLLTLVAVVAPSRAAPARLAVGDAASAAGLPLPSGPPAANSLANAPTTRIRLAPRHRRTS